MEGSQQNTTKEQTFRLFSKSGKAWATLLLLGDAERGTNDLPAFVEGAPVAGRFSLNLDTPESIHTILISLRGQIITGAHPNEMFTFLDVSQTLWSRSMGDPSNPGGPKWSKNLLGAYTWPFSLTIPAMISLAGEEFSLPQSFFERHTRGQIEYEICVKIMRKLRTDHRLSTVVQYFPLTRPGPPSGLRQLAYAQQTALLGPDSDPDGWKTLPAVKATGRLNSQIVEVNCLLSLATPLCYPRGTSIPCVLEIESNDPAALDILASPDSVVLRLRRNVRFHSRDKQHTSRDVTLKPVWKDEFQYSEMATWWRPVASETALDSSETLISGGPLRRVLKGELQLQPDLTITSSIAHYRLEYAVLLLPFDAQGYESLDTGPLIVESVEVASDLALGTPSAQRSCDN